MLDFAGAAQRHGSSTGVQLDRTRRPNGVTPYKTCPIARRSAARYRQLSFCGYVWHREAGEKRVSCRVRADRDRPAGPFPVPVVRPVRRRPALIATASTPGAACSSTASHCTRSGRPGRAAPSSGGRRPRRRSWLPPTTSCARWRAPAPRARAALALAPGEAQQRELLRRAGYADATLNFGLSSTPPTAT